MPRQTGTYQILGETHFFIPFPLPPINPPFELSAEIMSCYGNANAALTLLNDMGKKLPNAQRFIKAYVIKEALLTSSIEGIHTTLLDVFTYPLEGKEKPNKNTQLVLNYTAALDVAVEMLVKEKLPLTSRIILAAHKTLLTAHGDQTATPGSYRKQSVKVGTLIPPPAPEILSLMAALEKYINEPSELPPLIRAGLAHVQFETIHPFLDGNGRIGRLLIVLMLMNDRLLQNPILYPSYYLKKHHTEYYQKLDAVRSNGDFEGWILFYLRAITESAHDAYQRAQEIEILEKSLVEKIKTISQGSKTKETIIQALNHLFEQPVIGISQLSEAMNIAYNTASTIIKQYLALNILVANNQQKRNKTYRFDAYLKLLEKDFSI